MRWIHGQEKAKVWMRSHMRGHHFGNRSRSQAIHRPVLEVNLVGLTHFLQISIVSTATLLLQQLSAVDHLSIQKTCCALTFCTNA